ncbi:MAG: hypothetical protein WA419_12990 [Silvibacterium sp.]
MRATKNRIGLILAIAVGVLLLTPWAYDVHKDRKHVVLVDSPTPIFTGKGDEDCDQRPNFTTAQPGMFLRVRRVRYWKNCATVNVTLPDGREGYIVLGNGKVTVNPPLSN